MLISSEMLFFLLCENHPLQAEQIGTENIPIRQIQILRGGDLMESDTLYIVKHPSLLQDATSGECRCYLLCQPMTDKPDYLRASDTCAAPAQETEAETLLTILLEHYHHLMRWDMQFSEAILHREDCRKILSWGREVLPWDYGVIDTDMEMLYGTPGYLELFGEGTTHVTEDVVYSLMMQPEFHAAAKLKKSFYYCQTSNNRYSLCGNVFVEDRYVARVVMYIGENNQEIPIGAREIFECFVSHTTELMQYSNQRFNRHSKEQLRILIQTMADGKQPDPAWQSSVLEEVGWHSDDTYHIFQLSFYEAAGWDTQLGTTLPYLTHELEKEWEDSCAITDGTSILWLINISLSGAEISSYSFQQQMTSFVRDHMCYAGISAAFQDISQIPYAILEAKAALSIGQVRHPHFWYFLFDDYRLDYMMEKIQEKLPASMLSHPAITRLRDYDSTHHTELLVTLKAYLQSNLNMTAAADQLYIHRTTFCRRMKKIQEITQLDLKDQDVILSLLLSYRMLSL